MELFGSEWWTELALQLLVALLTTVLGMLTYDRAVARPAQRRLRREIQAHIDRGF